MTGVDQSYGDAPVAREERAFAVQRALGTSTYADGLLAPSSDDELRDIAAPLSTSELAREAFRARLIGIAAHREHRSAYEIVFIMLAASLAILLAAPPLVRIFLAMRGIEV